MYSILTTNLTISYSWFMVQEKRHTFVFGDSVYETVEGDYGGLSNNVASLRWLVKTIIVWLV